VTFSGAASTDPQGQALTYVWDFGDQTKGSGVSPTHTYAQVAGSTSTTYTVGLTVTDTSGLSSQATSKATIQGITPLVDAALTGVVKTGNKPASGAHVYLYAANTAGYGQATFSLLSAALTVTSDTLGAYVLTDPFGKFTMSGAYTCTSGQQLYIYALGGDSGSGANSASGLLAVIGSCPSSSGPAITVTVNEVTTIAAAYTMAPYAADATHVSSSGTPLALVGIANAFANAANLVTLSTGVALATTPAGNGTVPQAEINSLANILAACVSSGSSASANCTLLFTNATAGGFSGGSIPTETATAAINIAHNPAVNTTSLFNIPGSSTPFLPVLGGATNDFTIALSFAGGGLNGPQGIAIDGSGNAWVTNFSGNSVTKLSSLGAVLSPAGGYTGNGLNNPFGIAIDGSGNAWVANYGNSSVTEITSAGTFPSGATGYTAGGLNHPRGIAIDGLGNAWIANYGGNSVTKLSSSGTAATGSPFTGGLNQPFGIAVDGSGNAWISNYLGNSVTALSSSGSAVSGSPFTGGALLSPVAVALDSSGNEWIANGTGASITKLSHAGAVLSGTTGYTGIGIGFPYGIAVDGSGNVWTANQNPYNITEFSSSGAILSGPNSYSYSGLNLPTSIVIDGSGNAWVANNGNNTVSEFVGVASPVVTPIVAGLPATPTAGGDSKLGTRP
jgi:streptogramin lyase